MIIWRGLGILVPVIPVAIWLFVPKLFQITMPQNSFANYFRFISAFCILLGALALWFLGKKLNGTEGRTLVDEKTGEKMVLRANHSLFFINMEYWAIPLAILFLLVLFG